MFRVFKQWLHFPANKTRIWVHRGVSWSNLVTFIALDIYFFTVGTGVLCHPLLWRQNSYLQPAVKSFIINACGSPQNKTRMKWSKKKQKNHCCFVFATIPKQTVVAFDKYWLIYLAVPIWKRSSMNEGCSMKIKGWKGTEMRDVPRPLRWRLAVPFGE